jgi:aspartate carbamoyltransferase catalytic subunit
MEHFDWSVEGKKVAIVGDIVSSRVASSIIRLFYRFGIEVVLVAQKEFMPKSELAQFSSIGDVIDDIDVIISLRAQLERHTTPIFEDYDEYAREYCIDMDRLGDRDILVLHPGPVMRNIDISDDVLEDSRCKVLTQVKNGVYIRMAILKLLLLDS